MILMCFSTNIFPISPPKASKPWPTARDLRPSMSIPTRIFFDRRRGLRPAAGSLPRYRAPRISKMGSWPNLRAMSESGACRLRWTGSLFHGATNGLNNFLHLARLADTPNIVVFDGDESKAGRFLPACPNPIRAVDDPPMPRFRRSSYPP